ncbi:HD family phosphohydrolase [Lachnoclostridium edouardi]|uniref:HD family phosphohydrolase n=1 Tax=Lachnoclostridium edouardi TaxID=1926283 RepID=UPI0015E096D8|nr:HD family phosphohydrolase [Lachnoclostridium edouardi]
MKITENVRKKETSFHDWKERDLWTGEYEKDEEYVSYVKDILEHPVFKSMDHFIQHGHTTCKMHCIQVSYLSYKICKKHGWDFIAAARGGLLHDLFLYDWHTHARDTGNHFHGFTHPRTAMNNAILYFNINKKEQEIILRHMWPLTPTPPTTMAGMAIVFADKYCSLAEVGGRIRQWCTFNLKFRKVA